MKTKLILLAAGGVLLLAASALLAQNPSAANRAASSTTNLNLPNSTNLFNAALSNLPPGSLSNLPPGYLTNMSLPNGTNAQSRNKVFTGEQLLFSPSLKEKLKLTAAQQAELAPFEAEFAATSDEFRTANQPRIDAAIEADQQARAAKNAAQIQAANAQMQQVWAGLKPYQAANINRIRHLLTPAQIKILEDPKNQ